MSPTETLAAQARALIADLDREHERVMGRAQSRAGLNGSGDMNALISTRLAGKLDLQRGKLGDLLGSIANGSELAEERKDFRDIQRDCRDLFGECLALSTTHAIRALNLDGGACDILERFLRGLGNSVGVPWPHLTALADAEFFATASQVIRLRYPTSNIWDFPVAAHEFGHFVGPRWPSDTGEPTGYQAFLDVQDLGPKHYLNEYFADMFATFVLGPAYVNTCLLHRFDPAVNDDPTHPSDRKRAFWILQGLQLLASETKDEETSKILKSTYCTRWSEWNLAVSANGGEPLDQKAVLTPLRSRARELWKALRAWARNAGFLDIRNALKLRADFVRNPDPQYATAPTKVRDILNAAWLLRLDHENDLGRAAVIDNWARTLCMRVTE